MKQKFNTGRKNKKTVKKVLVGVGAGLLVLAAASGVAYGLNTHYKWVELPPWLTLPSEEVPAEPDYAVVVIAIDQGISGLRSGELDYSPSTNPVPADENIVFISTFDLVKIQFDSTVQGYTSISLMADPINQSGLSLPYEIENGFIYDFSELTVVEGEALVPVVTAIA